MARPLKVFTVHSHVSHLPPHIINDVLGAPRHISQGGIFVVARTKKDAARFLGEKLGGRYATSVIDEATGNHIAAFTSATRFLATISDAYEGTIAVSWGGGDRTFAVEGVNGWKVVGRTTHIDPENPRRHLRMPIFVPAAPEQPKAEPVRITIELDADTEPELAAKLIAGVGVRVTFGRITAHDVVGKVVE